MMTSFEKRLERRKRLMELDRQLKKKRAERKTLANKRASMESAFQQLNKQPIMKAPHQMKRFVRSSGAYVLGRRNRKELYSKAYRKKKAANELKNYTYHLYELGFTKKALEDMKQLHEEATSEYVRQATAWELGLWYANKQTKDGAACALPYFQEVRQAEDDPDMLRKLAIMEAECYVQLEEPIVAKSMLYEAIQQDEHPDLYLALANTTSDITEKAAWMNIALQAYGLQPIAFDGNSYDDLTTVGKMEDVLTGPKVSVIVPAYNAEKGIETTLRSLINQTWRNLEIIVVDDCSTDRTREVVQEYMEKDVRIQLLQTPKNSGAYVARNMGLDMATGDYVTVHDSDDWSHARKIEIQAQYLLDHPFVIANTSEHARLTEDLQFYRRGRPGSYIFSNMSSLMFRREAVLRKVGYWDPVRFAADSEFIRRIQKAFGRRNMIHVATGPLSFPRQSNSSLTGSSKFGYNGFLMGARKEYAEAQRYYHQRTKNIYYPKEPKQRPFPAPQPMIEKNKKRSVDLVIAADFRKVDEALVKEISAAKEAGWMTGLVQVAEYNPKQKPVKTIHESFRELIDGEQVQMLVYGEAIRCDICIIHNPLIFKEKQKFIPDMEPGQIYVVITKLGQQGELRQASRNISYYFDTSGKWYPRNEQLRKNFVNNYSVDREAVSVSSQNWPETEDFIAFIKPGFMRDNLSM